MNCHPIAYLQTILNANKYAKATKTTRLVDLELSVATNLPDSWDTQHPLHSQRFEQYATSLSSAMTYNTIAFGDSMLDVYRKTFTAVSDKYNFSISGSWANHMSQMARDMKPFLSNSGRLNNVRFLIVGSLGGNPLLLRQPIDVVIQKCILNLDIIRVTYPGLRFIVFGIPPTVSIYANIMRAPFEAAMYGWVLKDGNSVFVPLIKQFGSFFPESIFSMDGVHFTPYGNTLFNDLLKKSKNSMCGSIIK